MKFFKHFTDAGRGQSLRGIRRQLGMAGVGMYWSLVEVCAEKLDKTDDETFTVEHCRFSFDLSYLANILGTKSGHVRIILGSFQDHSVITWEQSGNVVRIEMPKLLECLDRDSKRARQRRASAAPVARQDKDKEEDKDKDQDSGEPAVRLAEPIQKPKPISPPLGYAAFEDRFDEKRTELQNDATNALAKILGYPSPTNGLRNLTGMLLREVNWDHNAFFDTLDVIESKINSAPEPMNPGLREFLVKQEFGLAKARGAS